MNEALKGISFQPINRENQTHGSVGVEHVRPVTNTHPETHTHIAIIH